MGVVNGISLAIVAWVWLSGMVLPTSWGPWRLSDKQLWVDKCCMDPQRGISSEARIQHMRRVVATSERMVVLMGDQYLSRLWCVYEPSEFVLLHRKSLEGRLLVIGLDWPAWWNPINWMCEPTLSKAEEKMIARFSCRL